MTHLPSSSAIITNRHREKNNTEDYPCSSNTQPTCPAHRAETQRAKNRGKDREDKAEEITLVHAHDPPAQLIGQRHRERRTGAKIEKIKHRRLHLFMYMTHLPSSSGRDTESKEQGQR